jgi:single-strand DNA-binding protein
MRYTAGGTAVVTFGMATNKSWKSQDGNMEESTQFHNVVAWNKMAEICNQLLTKGMKVYVEGELNTRSWEGEDGVTRYKTEIRVNDMILLDSKGKAPAGGEGASAPSNTGGAAGPADSTSDMSAVDVPDDIAADDPTEDDLPF